MRKRIILAALAALATLTGCRHAEQEAEPALKTVRFRAETADTRTSFAPAVDGVYQTLWTENDREILLSLNYGKAEPSAVKVSADGKTAVFEAAFDAAAASAPYTFYAVSPASAARAISPSRNAWSVYVAADQTPSALSVDEAAQLLVAKSKASATLPEDVDLHFAHLTAYGRIALQNLNLGDETVTRVELVFSTPVVGEWYWGEDGKLVSNGASHTITLRTNAADDLWFACAPVPVGGETLTLKVYGNQVVLSKTIAFPEGRTFASGKVARFSVDMADAEATVFDGAFLPVTDPADLEEDGEYLIVNAEQTYALGAQSMEGTAHRERVSIVVDGGKVVDAADATVLTLKAGSAAGTWSFHTGTGYLSAAAEKNVLQESAVKNGLSSWSISISDEGIATIEAQEGSSTLIRYNNSSPRFACYKASSTNMRQVMLFRRPTGTDNPTAVDPLTEIDEYGCHLEGAEWTYAPGSDQLFRSYDENGALTFTLLNPSARKQLVVSGFDPSLVQGQEAEVTVQYRVGKEVLLVKSFRLFVVREDGPKVWLSAGKGRGIILKK